MKRPRLKQLHIFKLSPLGAALVAKPIVPAYENIARVM